MPRLRQDFETAARHLRDRPAHPVRRLSGRYARLTSARFFSTAPLAAGTAAQIARLPETMPRDLEASHIFQVPYAL
jgi:hypothetical protein